MHIIALTKPVPDPAAEGERLDSEFRLDRSSTPSVINGNDEYALEAALKLVETHGGEVTLLAMTPIPTDDAIRRGLAMGAARAVVVSDPALAGSCALTTTRVLTEALRTLEFDLVLAGVDTSDGNAGLVPAGIATSMRLPYLSYATAITPDLSTSTVRAERIGAAGREIVMSPMPAILTCTQVLGPPRYPSLRGIMAARTKEISTLTLSDLGLEPETVGGAAPSTRVVDAESSDARRTGRARVLDGEPEAIAESLVAFLEQRGCLS